MATTEEPQGAGSVPDAEEGVPGAPRSKMSFLEHLDELRRRLFRAAIALVIAFAVCLYFSEQLLHWLVGPIEAVLPPGTHLAVVRPAEAFMNKMKAAFVGGIVLAIPVVLYQLWAFISPGLYRKEKRWVGPIVFFGTALFCTGVAFCYKVALPSAIGFLVDQSKGFTTVITIDSAFSFSSTLLLGMGAVFELPIVIFALARLDLITAKFLWKKFDIAIFVIFVLAAIITPTPDMITQTIFALPMIGLYLISIVVAYFARPKPVDGGTA